MVTRALVAPVAFLLAATVAVGVVRTQLRHHHAARTLTTVKKAVAAKPRRSAFYVVHAGDTLSAIASKQHLSLAALQQLNPQVQPTALFLGEKIRLRSSN